MASMRRVVLRLPNLGIVAPASGVLESFRQLALPVDEFIEFALALLGLCLGRDGALFRLPHPDGAAAGDLSGE